MLVDEKTVCLEAAPAFLSDIDSLFPFSGRQAFFVALGESPGGTK